MRSKMRACSAEMAFAQIWGTPKSTRLAVISTDASMDVPTPTTATRKSAAPAWSKASGTDASASTRWVRREYHCCTTAASFSTPSTGVLSVSSALASAVPNRPSPITRMPDSSSGRLERNVAATDRPFFRQSNNAVSVVQRERCGDSHGSGTTHEHSRREHIFATVGQIGRNPGGQPARRERRYGFEQDDVQGQVGNGQQDEARDEDEGCADEHHRHGQAQDAGGDAPPPRLDVPVTAGFGPDR